MNKKEKEECLKRWKLQRDLIEKYTGLDCMETFLLGYKGHKKLYNYVLVKENLIKET